MGFVSVRLYFCCFVCLGVVFYFVQMRFVQMRLYKRGFGKCGLCGLKMGFVQMGFRKMGGCPGQVWEFFQQRQKILYILKMCFSISLVLDVV